MINFQKSKHSPLIEIALVAVVFFVSREVLGSVMYGSQIAEILSLILITYLLKARSSSWRELGLRLPNHWPKAILYFVLCVVTIGLVFNFIIQPLFPHGANEINSGDAISFNKMMFQLIFIGIGTAAIGEEMLLRGFLLNRLNDYFGRNSVGTIAAVFIQALVFAVLHSGVQGMISAGVIGLIIGTFYVLANRNLLVVMAAHAVPDVLSIISSYQNQ